MYFETPEIIRAMDDTGIRLQTTSTLMNVASKDTALKLLDDFKNAYNKYNNTNSRLTFNAGIHGLYTCDENYIMKCLEFAKPNNIRIHMHFCENQTEVSEIEKMHNGKPVDVLKKYFKEMPICLAHCVKLKEHELEELKEMNVSVSHCPVSNLKLGCGIANITKMTELGINVSLGTDGQGSGSNLDMFETMKFAALMQKGILEDPTVMNAYDVMKMATINGAKALGLEEKIGTITEGKQADLIILNVENTEVRPYNNIFAEIVYNVKGRNVDTTIVDGKILMENRRLNLNINKEEVFEKCNEIIKRISL